MNRIKTTSKTSDFFHVRQMGRHYVINWDRETVKDEQGGDTDYSTYWQCAFTHKPSIEEIKSVILGEINAETDSKILQGFVWRSPEGSDISVWLSSENQFNYKAVYDLAVQTGGSCLPYMLKFGAVDSPQYYTFSDLDTLGDFYVKSVQHINSCIQEGWRKKDAIDWDDYIIK